MSESSAMAFSLGRVFVLDQAHALGSSVLFAGDYMIGIGETSSRYAVCVSRSNNGRASMALERQRLLAAQLSQRKADRPSGSGVHAGHHPRGFPDKPDRAVFAGWPILLSRLGAVRPRQRCGDRSRRSRVCPRRRGNTLRPIECYQHSKLWDSRKWKLLVHGLDDANGIHHG